MNQPEKIYIRFSNESDAERLREFYKKYPHEHVYMRDPAVFESVVKDGGALLAEDAANEICAVSITYPMKKDGAVKWQEVGTTRIVRNGYPRFFEAFMPLQVISAYLLNPPEDRVLCQMKEKPVMRLASSVGWRPYPEVTEEVMQLKRAMHPDRIIPLVPGEWFQYSREALPFAAAKLLAVIEQPVVTNKKGQELAIDFSRLDYFHYIESEVRRIAALDGWPANNNSNVPQPLPKAKRVP